MAPKNNDIFTRAAEHELATTAARRSKFLSVERGFSLSRVVALVQQSVYDHIAELIGKSPQLQDIKDQLDPENIFARVASARPKEGQSTSITSVRLLTRLAVFRQAQDARRLQKSALRLGKRNERIAKRVAAAEAIAESDAANFELARQELEKILCAPFKKESTRRAVQALFDRIFLNKSPKDLAAKNGMSVPGLDKRLMRARAFLKSKYRPRISGNLRNVISKGERKKKGDEGC